MQKRRIETKEEFKGCFAKESKPTVNLSSRQSKKPVRSTDDHSAKIRPLLTT